MLFAFTQPEARETLRHLDGRVEPCRGLDKQAGRTGVQPDLIGDGKLLCDHRLHPLRRGLVAGLQKI